MQSTNKISKESQFWERGTKIQKNNDSRAHQRNLSFQGQQNLSDKQSSNSSASQSDGKKQVHIPKLKERNPFGALKHMTKEIVDLPTETEEQKKTRATKVTKLESEIKALFNSFNVMKYNAGEFMTQVVAAFDSVQTSNNQVIEFVLGQAKLREMFRNLTTNQTSQLSDALLNSVKNNNQQGNKESCVRFLGHISFERNEFDANTLKKIINQVCGLAFNFKQNYSNNNTINKLAKPSINCLGNILTKDSPVVKENSEMIFKKLKDCSVQLMKNVQANYKSKRFISLLTTVVRALQLSMSQLDQIKVKKTSPDTDAVILFLNFYKILFMGTDFANKVLQLRLLDNSAGSKASKSQQIKQITIEEETKVEGGVLDGSFIIDTSDFSSSNEFGGNKQNSPSTADSVAGMHDPYHKLKIYAIQSLSILFKMCNKAFTLQNLWFLIFPSFLTRPRPELHQLVKEQITKEDSLELFAKEALEELKKEPNLFFLIQNEQENMKIRQQVVMSIVSLIQHSDFISKWQVVIKPDMDDSHTVSDGGIGQFLLSLHYLLPVMIQNERDIQLMSVILKVVATLLQVTPYQNFKAPLASNLLKHIITILKLCLDPEKLSARFATTNRLEQNQKMLMSQCLSTLAVGFGVSVIKNQLQNQIVDDNLILNLVEVSKSKFGDEFNLDLIIVFQKLALNFDKQLTHAYQRQDQLLKGYLEQVFNDKSDSKLIVQAFKLLEEWVKNMMPSTNLGEDEDDFATNTQQQQTQSNSLQLDKDFTKMLNQVIQKYLNRKQTAEMNIIIISLLNYFNADLWVQVFETNQKVMSIADYLLSLKNPPILKAASLRALGTIVLLPLFNKNKDFLCKVFQFVIESCNDVNLSVQIRNSQACSSLCSILVQTTDNEAQTTVEDETDDKLIIELLVVALNYAVSSKEKVSSNAIRGLGNYLGNTNLEKLEQTIIPQLNKSQIKLNDCSSQLVIDSILRDSLRNKSPKVNWNATIVIGKLLAHQNNKDSKIVECLHQSETIKLLLNMIQNKTNLKAKIHAAQTLLKYDNIIKDRQLIQQVWQTLNEALAQKSKFIGFTLERKYMETFESQFLQLWGKVAEITNEDDYQKDNEAKKLFADYVNENGYLILQNSIDYLTKELKVPQYSWMFTDTEAFEQDTIQIFKDDPQLINKLQQLKKVFTCVQNQIEKNDLIRVSFANYDQFNQLAKSEVLQYRKLKCLRPQEKTSFNPTFEERAENILL